MAALILLVLSSFGFGILLCAAFARQSSDMLFLGACRLAAGTAVWCLLLFVLGLTGCLKPLPIYIVTGISSVFAVGFILRQRSLLRRRLPTISPTEWILAGCCISFLCITFIVSFCPVSGGISNDEIHTHLSVPAAWLRSSSIAPLSYPVSYMAANGELLFLFATIFSRDTGPHLVSWFAFLLNAYFVYQIARHFLARTPSLTAAVIVIVNPLLFRHAPIAFVDSIATMFMLASLAIHLRWRKNHTVVTLAIAAFMAGTACGVKPINFIYSALLAMMVLIDLLRTPTGFRLRRVTIAAAVLVATAAVWPVRLLLLTGSPTFPPPPGWVAAGLPQAIKKEPIPYSAQEVEGFYRYVYSRYGDYQRSLPRLIALPWEATMQPERFQAGDSIGTLLLSLLPISLIVIAATRRYRNMAGLAIFSLLSIAGIYLLVLPEARYFGTALCVLAPVMAIPFARDTGTRTLRAGCWCLLSINILFATAIAVRIESRNVRIVFDKKYREHRLKEQTPFYEALRFISANYPLKTVVVLYESPIWYYLSGTYIVDGDASRHPEKYPGALLLDIDYSQITGRLTEHCRGDYALTNAPMFLRPLFEGSDARVYLFTDNNDRGRL